MAGSDCGFGTFVGLDLVDGAIAWPSCARWRKGRPGQQGAVEIEPALAKTLLVNPEVCK